MSSLRQTVEEAYQYAGERQLSVIQSHPRILQLDLDTAEDVQFMRDQLRLWVDAEVKARVDGLPVTGYKLGKPMLTKSKSGHWHAYIRVNKPLTLQQRIMFQACLGSDRKRELLSLMRQCRGESTPVLLFETKQYAGAARGVAMTIERAVKEEKEEKRRKMENMEVVKE